MPLAGAPHRPDRALDGRRDGQHRDSGQPRAADRGRGHKRHPEPLADQGDQAVETGRLEGDPRREPGLPGGSFRDGAKSGARFEEDERLVAESLEGDGLLAGGEVLAGTEAGLAPEEAARLRAGSAA
jgi:hypothetical protein